MARKLINWMGVERSHNGTMSIMTFCVMDAERVIIANGKITKPYHGPMDLLEETYMLAKLYKAQIMIEENGKRIL